MRHDPLRRKILDNNLDLTPPKVAGSFMLVLLLVFSAGAQEDPDLPVGEGTAPQDLTIILANFRNKLVREHGVYKVSNNFLARYESNVVYQSPPEVHSNQLPPKTSRRIKGHYASRDAQAFFSEVTANQSWKGVLDGSRSLSLVTDFREDKIRAIVSYDPTPYNRARFQLERAFPTFSNRFPLTNQNTSFSVTRTVMDEGEELVEIRVDHEPMREDAGYGLVWVDKTPENHIRRVALFGDKKYPIEEVTYDDYRLLGSLIELPYQSTFKIFSISWRKRSYTAYQEERRILDVSLGATPLPDNTFHLKIPNGVQMEVAPPKEQEISSRLKPVYPPPLAKGQWLGIGPDSLKELRGNLILIEFLSRSSPEWQQMKQESIELTQFAQENGIAILGIHPPDKETQEVRKFLLAEGITYPVMIDDPDPTRGGAGSTFSIYEVYSLPDRFLIDREGRILAASTDVNLQSIKKALEPEKE